MRKTVMEMTPFYVVEVFERAEELERQGRSIIHLEVGEPDFPTPDCIKKAAEKAIREGKTRYTASLGLLELRETIAEYYLEKYGVSISPNQIIVTNGSSPALMVIFSALLETGDEVILSDPHYACYPNMVKFLGCTPVFVKLNEDEEFRFDPDKRKDQFQD